MLFIETTITQVLKPKFFALKSAPSRLIVFGFTRGAVGCKNLLAAHRAARLMKCEESLDMTRFAVFS